MGNNIDWNLSVEKIYQEEEEKMKNSSKLQIRFDNDQTFHRTVSGFQLSMSRVSVLYL